ncbi:hypothetical protein NP233_g1382 [Leucocoprinus birnbaumii]|uniref:Peptidase M14 domain-containing protein n=1 Tax=Leucocoprinus birnbaumii TaxID=56174 RepID=A0AAD5W369_9AGAR|nr:hypothetical protein NP233_g1382 [Leucocoprinus birnbaumii]
MASGLFAHLPQIYVIFLFISFVFADGQVVLDGHTPTGGNRTSGILRRFTVNHERERDRILDLANEISADIWQLAHSHIDIYAPVHGEPLPDELLGIHHTSSIIKTPEPSYPSLSRSEWNLSSFTNSTFHDNYHPLFEIDEFMQELAELHPDLVKLHNIGHSAEGREMVAMTVSAPPTNSTLRGLPGPGKLGFVIVGAQHAREWVATSASMYIAHALVANSSEFRSLRQLLDTFDFHIIPAPNPDGYTYTWEVDRYWYKNRQVIGPNLKCVGVDMNRCADCLVAYHWFIEHDGLANLIRNWGYKWKPTVGNVPKMASPRTFRPKLPADPCSFWFPGHRAFEAPEVNNMANFVTTLPNLVGFLDLRSYGQFLSTPFSYSCKKMPKDAEDQTEAAMGAANALKSIHGTQFKIGALCDLVYPAPGNIVDWMYKIPGIKFSYVAHLRDTGTYGFSLPESWIRPVGEETARMVEYISTFVSGRIKRQGSTPTHRVSLN